MKNSENESSEIYRLMPHLMHAVWKVQWTNVSRLQEKIIFGAPYASILLIGCSPTPSLYTARKTNALPYNK
jgi:hypothetical protein